MRCITALPVGLTFDGVFPTVANLLRERPNGSIQLIILEAEGLICAIRYLGFLFQTAPADIVAEPQQITVLIGHLTGDADLVTVEVVGLLHLSPSSLMWF